MVLSMLLIGLAIRLHLDQNWGNLSRGATENHYRYPATQFLSDVVYQEVVLRKMATVVGMIGLIISICGICVSNAVSQAKEREGEPQ